MNLFITIWFLIASALADVSHLKQSGYVYNVPSPAFDLPSAPIKEHLPPASQEPIEEQLPEVIPPQPEYLPPTPVLPPSPSNEYLPPANPLPSEPVKEYLPPSDTPSTEYLPPSAAPTEEYQSAKEIGGYRYDAPLTKFRF